MRSMRPTHVSHLRKGAATEITFENAKMAATLDLSPRILRELHDIISAVMGQQDDEQHQELIRTIAVARASDTGSAAARSAD
jgi:hypothetical protein